MSAERETLKKIAEDAFLLAANIRTGEDLEAYVADDPAFAAAAREWRIIELLVEIGERIVDAAGIPPGSVWTPATIRDVLDADYAPDSPDLVS